jgi:hypothetical protein
VRRNTIAFVRDLPGDRGADRVLQRRTLALTLDGARSDRTATGITWQFEDVNGAVLRSGSVAC